MRTAVRGIVCKQQCQYNGALRRRNLLRRVPEGLVTTQLQILIGANLVFHLYLF